MSIEPTVSVLIANLDGRAHLGPCLDSLLNQDYPRERTEIVMVDNGSSDDSAAFVRESYPSVRLIEAGKNLGFAGGNNVAARAAAGDYLALINTDAEAAPDWISAMIAATERDPEAACVAAKLLSSDGTTIDFVRSALSPAGRAFQIDEGLPAGASPYEAPDEVFAPCGGAMLIRKDIFLAVEGFDETYTAYYEDVDLGWRLWLLGYKVVFAPDAVVYHRGHETGARFGIERRAVLAEMNALRTIIKNYDDENLARMLPISLLLGVKRSLAGAHVDLENYTFQAATPAGDEPESFPRPALASLVAIDMIAGEMGELLERRRAIQTRRVRTDAEIFSRFPLWPYSPVFPWRPYNVAQDRLLSVLDRAPQVAGGRRRLLVITHETLGPMMAGPGIRAWELSRALAANFDVTLAASGTPSRSAAGLRVVGFDPGDPHLAALAPFLAAADVVMVLGALVERYPLLQDFGKPLIVDLYDPYELERFTLAEGLPAQARKQVDQETRTGLQLQSLAGDFYVCASDRQRDLWIGILLAAGRINSATLGDDPTLRKLIDVAPFGIPEEPPAHRRAVMKGVVPGIGPEDRVLLWNGGLWDWLDPLTLVEAMPLVLAECADVRLWFAATQHFNPGTVPEMRMADRVMARCRELGLLDREVFFGAWIPYDERGDYLLEADLGISTHPASVESRFASRTRLLDCFWAGLPVVVSAGDPLADLVEARGLGLTVPPADPQALARAILKALADETLRTRVTACAASLRDSLSWSRCAAPITGFMSRATFAVDALEAAQRADSVRRQNATEATVRALNATIESLHQERAQLQQTNAQLQQERAQLQQANAHLQQESSQLQQSNAQLQHANAELQLETGKLLASQTRLQQEREAMAAHLEAIRRGWAMRFLRATRVLFGRE